MARGGATEQAAKTTFRDVFAAAEFRALWLAQLLSVIGDQLARVALTVLVYDRTRSALLAAVTFVASIVPTFVGGITLAWLADRHPRRGVMIVCDLARCALVLVMAIPGMPLAGMVALLFLVTLVGALRHQDLARHRRRDLRRVRSDPPRLGSVTTCARDPDSPGE